MKNNPDIFFLNFVIGTTIPDSNLIHLSPVKI